MKEIKNEMTYIEFETLLKKPITIERILKEFKKNADKFFYLQNEYNKLVSKIKDKDEEIDSLKCCGNCLHYHDGKAVPCMEWPHWNECCKHWEYDGWTAETRKAGEE